MDNPYVRLTREFNAGRLRAVLASGQAVVLYRLAIMSKDGDWILKEEDEALSHVLATLARRGARYCSATWLRRAGGEKSGHASRGSSPAVPCPRPMR
jgi:hypothetical protein